MAYTVCSVAEKLRSLGGFAVALGRVSVYTTTTMSHIIRRVSVASLLVASMALGACDSGEEGSDAPSGPSAGGKADDTTAGPIGALATGTQGSGYVAGDAVQVYVVEARPGSVINARVVRTSGDLDPTAYLFNGLRAAQDNDYEAPSHGFDNDASSIEAGWTVPSHGELLLIVGAGNGSAGEFAVELTCHDESPYPCTEGDDDSELGYCESLRDAWLVCMESEDESECNEWYGYEDTLDDENCCELWSEHGEPLEDFCG